MSPEWIRRYLALLGVPCRTPSLGALAELTRAQIRTVPFENVTSLLRRRAHPTGAVPDVDPGQLLDGWEQGRGGGVCFEAAPMFGRLLTALGYHVHPVAGFISFPCSHQALVVMLEDARYLVDVANGAPLFDPIPLEAPTEVAIAGLGYRFRPDDGESDAWLQERRIDGCWQPFCRYDLRPIDPTAQAAAYQRHHTRGQTWVLGSLTLIRVEDERVLVLRDAELTRYTASGKERELLGGPADYVRAAAEVFSMPSLPIAEGLAAWQELTRR